MTNHYNIQLVKTNTDLKLTYRNGKFQNLKHLRGVLDAVMVKYLGFIIPPKESDLQAFILAEEGKVIYTLEVKNPKTLLTKFKDCWTVFYRKENNNISPKHEGAETNALKSIIIYLIRINNGDEGAALANWNLLLSKWSELSEFHQKQMDLKYINSKMNVIIREIIKNNGSSVSNAGGSVSI